MESEHHVVYEHYRINKVAGLLLRYMRGHNKEGEKLSNWMPDERGGKTVCFILSENRKDILAYGYADCSLKDAFNYRLGRQISYGRAMKDLERRQHG